MLTRPPPAPRTFTTGRAPRGAQVRPFGGLQPLPCLVLEADEGAQVARSTFICGHTSAFHTATAASSRSMAWRTGTWADQPCRRISFQVPSTVYPTWNSLPISVLIRPSVQRWSAANPCASGPLSSSASSRAHCCGLSRSRDTGPFDRNAPAPPSCQARCHRRTDPSATRRSRAISVIVSPRANRPAACSRSRSRRCCSAGVYPPRCAYRMHWSYARNQPTSRPELYEFILCSCTDSSGHCSAGPRWAGITEVAVPQTVPRHGGWGRFTQAEDRRADTVPGGGIAAYGPGARLTPSSLAVWPLALAVRDLAHAALAHTR